MSNLRLFSLPMRVCLLGVCLTAVSLLAGCSGLFAPAAKDLNVILISYDTLRADRLGIYGYEKRETSPVLDRLAQRGVVFERAVSQASSTFPSHMSLFQSRWASQLSRKSPLLAQVLRRNGFRTAAFTNGGNVSGKLGFERGFDSYFETRSQSGLEEIFPQFESWLRQNDQEAREEPFFLFLHTYDIHHPYDPPAEYQKLFADGYEGRITGASTGPLLNKVRKIHNFQDFKGEVPLTAADKDHIRALYEADIRHADSYLERLDALLQELGLWDDTLVVFLSDHGEEFWEHGEVLHSFTVYEEMVHVPLVMWLPKDDAQDSGATGDAGGTRDAGAVGRPTGRAEHMRIPQQVRLLDVAPTILDVLGIDPPSEMEGESLLPLLAGTGEDRPAVAEMNLQKAWIEPPLKLIVDHENEELRVYDLVQDPGEQHPTTDGRLPRDLYRSLVQRLGRSAARKVSGPAQMDLPEDEELLEQLRSLGYLD